MKITWPPSSQNVNNISIPLDPPEDKDKENTSKNNTNSVSELNANYSEKTLILNWIAIPK